MKTVTYSRLLTAAGALTMLYSRWMPESIAGSSLVNIHLMSERRDTLLIGCVLFIGGIILQAAFRDKDEVSDNSPEASENKTGIQAGLVLRQLNSKAVVFLAALRTNWKGVLARLIMGLVVGSYMEKQLQPFIHQLFADYAEASHQNWKTLNDVAGFISLMAFAYAFRTKPILVVVRNLMLAFVFLTIAAKVQIFAAEGYIHTWPEHDVAAVLALMTAAAVQYWGQKKRGDTP